MNLKQIKKYITISPGNMKTGKIPSISLPPIVTCNPNAKCHNDCYVLKSYRLYPHVREAYQKNLNTFKTSPELYFQSISDWLTIKKPDYFRKGAFEPYLSMEKMTNIEAREYGKRVLTNYVVYLNKLGISTRILPFLNILTSPAKTDKFRK